MGRTVMPFSFMLEEERERWREFRRSRPKEDQKAFDRLFDRPKFHTPAAVSMSHPWQHENMLAEIQTKLKITP